MAASESRGPPPTVELATASDIHDIVKTFVTAFNSAMFQTFFPLTPEGQAYQYRCYESYTVEPKKPGRPEAKLYVVRDEHGLVAAAALYWIVREGDTIAPGSWKQRWEVPKDIPGMSEEKIDTFFNPMARSHDFVTKGRPHIFLEVLMTYLPYRKRGYGSALIQKGNELADELGWECYLDAAKTAAHVYRAHGYVEQDVSGGWEGEKKSDDLPIPMLRPAKTTQ